jgi:hypothetical protein
LTAQTAPPGHRSVLHVVAYAAGGSLLGAWAGYMTSQVARSDWEGGAGAQRLRFSVAGAGIGLVAGILVGNRRGEPAPAFPRGPRSAPPVITQPITAEEIGASSARSVTELLRQLRPQWLRSRGRDVLRLNADPTEAHGVRVYLNGGLLGGLDALDQVSIDAVTSVQFFDTGPAILRWGAGNEDGAILLTTRAAR